MDDPLYYGDEDAAIKEWEIESQRVASKDISGYILSDLFLRSHSLT